MRKQLAISRGGALLALLALLGGAAAQAATPAPGPDPAPLRVGVSVLPLEEIVRAIGGDAVEVQSLQREGDSCGVFEPRPSVISWLAGAQLFLRTGAAYETMIVGKLASQFGRLRVVDLREGMQLLAQTPARARAREQEQEQEHGNGHRHGPHCAAGCTGHGDVPTDPHIWLDPVRVAAMADRIAEELARERPGHREAFFERAAAFRARAFVLDERLRGLLEPHAGRAFYIYHPALGYFAARYGLRQAGIAGGSQPPGPRELQRLIARARADRVRTVFVQPQESRRHAEILAGAIGARLVEIDPMAAEWEAGLLRIGEALAAAFAEAP